MNLARRLNYYEILGVSRNATPEEIRKGYNETVKLFHPDVRQARNSSTPLDPIDEEIADYIVRKVINAKKTLNKERASYDASLTREIPKKELLEADIAMLKKVKESLDKGIFDAYRILGIPRSTNNDNTIKETFLDLAYSYSPELNKERSAREQQVINKVYRILKESYSRIKDQKSRDAYDDEQREAFLRRREIQKEQQKKEQNKNEATTESKVPQVQQNKAQEEKTQSEYTGFKTENYNYEKQEQHREKKEQKKTKHRKTLLECISESYKEVREEEKQQPFKKRHEAISERVRKNCYTPGQSFAETVLYGLGAGVIHVSHEFMFQLSKFKYITEDTVPKYIIRNRKSICGIVLAGIIITSLTGENNEQVELPAENTTAPISNNIGQNARRKKSNEITLNRVHTIRSGETLSEYSWASATSVEEIARLNNIEDKDSIMTADKIVIPYTISKGDLKYYVSAKECPIDMSLEDFAASNETDIETLLQLNEEAINTITLASGKTVYVPLSNSLQVPTFISRHTLIAQKVADASATSAYNGIYEKIKADRHV